MQPEESAVGNNKFSVRVGRVVMGRKWEVTAFVVDCGIRNTSTVRATNGSCTGARLAERQRSCNGEGEEERQSGRGFRRHILTSADRYKQCDEVAAPRFGIKVYQILINVLHTFYIHAMSKSTMGTTARCDGTTRLAGTKQASRDETVGR